MNYSSYYDFKIIEKAISILKPQNALYEIRIIGKGNNRKKVMSGYFKGYKALQEALQTIDPRQANIYITLNEINEACYSREQHDCFLITDATTHDHEIDRYHWLFIDLDPIRLAEISSSNAELDAAIELADKVCAYMSEIGFNAPIRALSGNGAHLLYRIDLPVNNDTKKLIERCLSVLADLFNTEQVKIDVVNFNPSRICKLYGTLAQKGANTKDRPHRMSEITSCPDEILVNSAEILRNLANELPETAKNEKKTQINNSNYQKFDLEDWLYRYLSPMRKDEGTNCNIYPLEYCPFDHSHKNGDSKIFHYSDGAIAFKCHHNSCRDKKWQDVRLLFEPDAYDDKDEENDRRIEEGWKKHKEFLTVTKTSDIEEIKRNLPKITSISAYELQNKTFEQKYYAVEDMIPEGETIIAAPPKTGKSWLMLDMCLRVAKGEQFLGFETNKSDTLYLALEDGDSFEQERLNIVMGGENAPDNFHFVFSNVMPMNEGFLVQLEELLKGLPNVRVVVIDTLQFIKYRQGKSESAYECDYRTGRDLKQFAEEHHLAIVVVTHTTKMIHLEDDMANVSGTNGVTGAADAVIVLNKNKRMDKEAKMFITGRKVRQTLHDIKFDDNACVWRYVGLADQGDLGSEQAAREAEYFDSNIRRAVMALANRITEPLKIKANQLIEEARKDGIGIAESNKLVGGFLSNMVGMFKCKDNIDVEVVKNGTGSRLYTIYPSFTGLTNENEDVF